MSCHSKVAEWTSIIHTHLPHLSKPQAAVLALWSLGMVLARSCALTAVSVWLAGCCSARRTPSDSSCASGATRPRPSGATNAKRSRWRRALCPCCSGSCAPGRARSWPWRSMPPRWGPASRSSPSAWSIAAVPSPWPGRFCLPPAPCLAPRVAADAASAAAGHSPRVDRHRVG